MLTTLALALLATSTTASPTKRQTQVRTKNYSGAKLLSSPDGTIFTYATTIINVPDTQFVSAEGSPGQLQASAAWVGYGGMEDNGIAQTGCVFDNDGQDDRYARCWTEFYPDPPVFYDDLPSPDIGDWIQLELYLTSPTTATSIVTNTNTGDQASRDFTAPDGHSVSGNNAEWIVENPGARNNLVNFQKEFFEGCQAVTQAGNSYGPGDGNVEVFYEAKDLGDGNGATQWTNSFLPSDSEVEVDWTGPT
ncbi:hypothetical protein DOTSEDRAFT_83155 [Dothistroma septosporum NZE10]|uniref:Concanavalin A-like lectin/glucanase n=1 Tax=Dothistroma septosporum (strain NZE10 / CBS 128990) TaxID=675120 RepID=M2YKJ6_DOTSN|nr:hypothetical protein DOTSEDRAFT_83155 [Dothistroma septosporum NZE10]